jgi:hypothetical protein
MLIMVKIKYLIIMVGILLTIIISDKLSAQTSVDLDKLARFSNWTYNIGPRFYQPASIKSFYGNSTFKNKIIPDYTVAILYDFKPDSAKGFVTGLEITTEPIYRIRIKFKKEDIFSQFDSDVKLLQHLYAIVSFSVPIMYRFSIPAENYLINIMVGGRIMYFPNGTAYLGCSFTNEDGSLTKEVFGLKVETQEFPFYAGFVLNAGYIIAKRKLLLKPSVTAVLNFPATMKGEYQFGNMFISEPSRGSYRLSGNYVSFNLGITFLKPKHPLFKVKIHTKAEE